VNLNSPFVEWALKFGLSKGGVLVTTLAAQLASHIIVWCGLAAFVSNDQLVQIQGGIEQGATTFGLAILSCVYAWLVHRQAQVGNVMKQQLGISSRIDRSHLDFSTGIPGNETLKAVAALTGVSIEKAAAAAGVTPKPGS
jgi:hypothetical protein